MNYELCKGLYICYKRTSHLMPIIVCVYNTNNSADRWSNMIHTTPPPPQTESRMMNMNCEWMLRVVCARNTLKVNKRCKLINYKINFLANTNAFIPNSWSQEMADSVCHQADQSSGWKIQHRKSYDMFQHRVTTITNFSLSAHKRVDRMGGTFLNLNTLGDFFS